jgi:hypothetical protein
MNGRFRRPVPWPNCKSGVGRALSSPERETPNSATGPIERGSIQIDAASCEKAQLRERMITWACDRIFMINPLEGYSRFILLMMGGASLLLMTGCRQ